MAMMRVTGAVLASVEFLHQRLRRLYTPSVEEPPARFLLGELVGPRQYSWITLEVRRYEVNLRRHFTEEVLLLDVGDAQRERLVLDIVARHVFAAHLERWPPMRPRLRDFRQFKRDLD